MPNGINLTAPNIRDFLLLRNLRFADTITDNNLSGYATGIGLPASISHSPESVQASINIEENGVFYKDLNLINNQFLPNDIQTYKFSFNNNNSFFTNQIVGGYLDKNGVIKGTGGNQEIDTISGFLTGASTFDIRTSLASRILSGSGVINDTKLGMIGNRELLNSMKAKALFNSRRELLGKINLNPISLLKGDSFINPDFSITIPSSNTGRVLDVGLNILGFESPISYMDSSASIFDYELYNDTSSLGESSKSKNLNRNNSRIQNTGRGQIQALFSQFNANLDPKFNRGGTRYTPNYSDSRTKNALPDNEYKLSHEIVSDGKRVIDRYARNIKSNIPFSWNTSANVINFENDIREGGVFGNANFDGTNRIDEVNVNTRKGGSKITDYNILSFPGKDQTFDTVGTLLNKTQSLFNKGRILTLLANKGMVVGPDNELMTTETQGGNLNMVSKGSAVKYLERSAGSSSDNPNDVFCRSWVNYHSYDRVNRLQKHTGLSQNAGLRTQNYKESVLDDNGFIRFGPYREQDGNVTKSADIKRYMFSLENLAWNSETANLPSWEIGPGDLITGTKGRIMWFPPYDLTFNEGASVNLDTTSFIGRGEPIYTYNNTERTGNISFKIIIDHPNYLNDKGFKERYSNYFDDVVNSIFSGCGEIPETVAPFLTQEEIKKIEVETATKNPTISIQKQKAPEPFKIYFPNDVSELNGSEPYTNYEISGSTNEKIVTPWQRTLTGGYTAGITTNTKGTYEDRFNYGLNKPWRNETFLNELKRKLREECPACRIEISGYASEDGKPDSNKKLSIDRASNIAKFFRENVINDEVEEIKKKRFAPGKENGTSGNATGTTGPKDDTPVDNINKKLSRYVNINFVADPEIDELNKKEFERKVADVTNKELTNRIKSRFFNESEHFFKLKQDDPIVYNSLKDKIKFFHPSFHSITPEGFSSRLTFLHQCTRQGPTKTENNNRPDNMAFGMAPVCILRLGDFYHTKIMIDNLSIDYENTWDLNPEGVGVQPMIATIGLSFKFIGGQSMQGPINRLQNAVAFNFFANSEIFDPRADKISVNSSDKKAKYVKGETEFGSVFDGKEEDKPGITTNKPEGVINQENVASNENASQSIEIKNANESEIIIIDKDVINCVICTGFNSLDNFVDEINLKFKFQSKGSVSNLILDGNNPKTYFGDITVNNGVDNVKINIGYIGLAYNDTTSIVLSFGNIVNGKRIETNNFIINNGSELLDIDFRFDIESEFVESIKTINNTIGSNLKIEWTSGSRQNISFYKNNSI